MSVDAIVLTILAASDVLFLAWLRRRRARRLRVERMYALLRLHLPETASRTRRAHSLS